MGMSSDWAIEAHNSMMETDAEYAEGYQRHCEEEAYHHHLWSFEMEKYLDHFSDYRIDHQGYEEFDDVDLEVETVGIFDDEDLPF